VTARATDDSVTRDRIVVVEQLIRPHVRLTPVLRIDRADFGLPAGPMHI